MKRKPKRAMPRSRHDVRRRRRSLQDVDEVAAYIGADHSHAQLRFLDTVEEAIKLLAERPSVGQLRGDVRNPRLRGLRSWTIRSFENYLIFYRIDDSNIEIVRVLHGARNLGTILADE